MQNLIIQKASAGSGKTFQLALCYIRMVLGYRDKISGKMHLYYPNARNTHREILAVTFTNKATEEMKERIISELTLLGDTDRHSDYRAILCEEFAVDEKKLAYAAKAALDDILFDYGHFQVSTIDSFFQMILRSFAYEADLSGNYELELDEKTINEQAINDTIGAAIGLNKSANGPTLSRWLEDIMRTLRKGQKSFNFINPQSSARSDLMKFVKDLTKEDFKKNPEAFLSFAADSESLNSLKNDLNKAVENSTANIIKTANEFLADHYASLNKAGKKKNRLENYLNALTANGGTWPLKTKTYNDFIEDPAVALEYYDYGDSEAAALLDQLARNIEIYFTALVMVANIHNYGLLSEILSAARELKISTNTILLSDTNTLLKKIINDSDTPFIYERISQRIKHFLIDEFQDTSELQWTNLRPLLLESLSKNNENLIIGDVKQSIYRFRNSDYKLLDHQIESDDALKEYILRADHGTNFRSSRTIVEFNNDLFERLASCLDFGRIYSTVRQQVKKSTQDGYVRIGVEALAEDENPAVSGLDLMLDDIRRQLAAGYRASDIAILAFTNTNATDIVNFLLSATTDENADPILRNVRIISDEALLISASPAVNYIVTQLRIISSGQEAEPDAYYTSELDMKRFEDILRDLRENQHMEPEEALDEAFRILHAADSEPAVSPDSFARGLSLYEVVEEIIANLPTKSWLQTESIYLCAFQDLVLTFCQSASPSIYDFLDFWDNTGVKAGVALSGNDDAIRVMTVHKSKGLEFPCVHIPIMPTSIFTERSFRWFETRSVLQDAGITENAPQFFPLNCENAPIDKTLFRRQYEEIVRDATLDRLNALYVAFTRARRELCVTLSLSRGKESETTSLILEILNGIENPEKRPFQPRGFTFGRPTLPDPNDKKTVEPSQTEPLTISTYKVNQRDWWSATEIAPADELE